MEDQIHHQTKRYEKLKAAIITENGKSTHVPQISKKSRLLVDKKADSPDRPGHVVSRLAGPPQPRAGSRASMHSRRSENEQFRAYGAKEGGSPKASSLGMSRSQRLFSPAISKKAANIKRTGRVEEELYKDGFDR